MIRDTQGWIEKYQQKRALWIHDGNPKRPHALLTSGKHSNGFFNSEVVMEDPALLDEACFNLLFLLKQEGLNLSQVDRVVGPAMGAITLAHDLARHIAQEKKRPCLRAYTQKEMDGDKKKMVFKRTTIKPGENVLTVEDVVSTGGSVKSMVNAVVEPGGNVLPFVAVLVNRSGLTKVSEKKIVALIDRPMRMWVEDQCPLCKAGSEAIRPKDTENWERLNA